MARWRRVAASVVAVLDASLNKLERWGFLRSEVVAVGDETAVPSSLRSLIKGRRAP